MDEILLPPEIENIKLYYRGVYRRLKNKPFI